MDTTPTANALMTEQEANLMLKDERFPDKWRYLSTLSAVIGASDEETKRLLVKANARGSEKADGKWGLISNHPFPDSK